MDLGLLIAQYEASKTLGTIFQVIYLLLSSKEHFYRNVEATV